MTRANYIGAPQFFNLNAACRFVVEAFPDAMSVCLVGSSIHKRDWRDVDVRCILADEDYDRLFPGAGKVQWAHPLWSLLSVSISGWLSARSGLPVDFQIQRMTDANAEYPDAPRHALGMFYAPAEPHPKEEG